MASNPPPIQENTTAPNGRFPQVWIRWLQRICDEVQQNTNNNLRPTHAYTQVDATYTATLEDAYIECTANTFDVTLPTAVGIVGRVFNVDNSGAGVITLRGDSASETINGAVSVNIASNNSITVMSNGSVWRVK